MANDLNQFTFTGRLGRDPESRALPSGEPVCNFSVAVGKQWKDKASGAKKEQTEWVQCAAFGKLSEICTQYLRKGSQLAAVGELRTRKWQDKNGQDRYTTEVILSQVTLLGGKTEGAAEPAPQNDRAPAPARQQERFEDGVPF
jgi:single-strand DNA-binding protein